MALPTLIEDKDRAWMFKVITQLPEPQMNACSSFKTARSGHPNHSPNVRQPHP